LVAVLSAVALPEVAAAANASVVTSPRYVRMIFMGCSFR